MSKQSAEKDGEKTVIVARAEGGRFATGNGGGPGRPKRGETRAEQVRRNVDWEKADARMLKILLDPKSKDADAIAAYRELNDRGYGRAVSQHELHVSRGDGGSYDLSALSDEQLAERLAWLRGQRAELAEGTPTEPDQEPTEVA